MTDRRPGEGAHSRLTDHIPALARYARRLTHQDPEDLVQATLEKALAADMAAVDAPEAYLIRMLRNLFLDRLRRAAAVEAPHVLPLIADSAPASQQAGMEFREVVAAIANLPRDQRQVLVMTAFEGLSYREIANQLGVPVGTVTSRIARARAALSEVA